MLCNKSIDKFQYIYDMLINESKNVPVPDQLAQDILNNFEYKNKIVYRKVDLMQLSKDYQYLSKHSKYTLTVFIINPEDVEETFSKSDYREFVDVSYKDISYGLSVNYGIYVPLRNDTGYLILNYQAIKNNSNILKNVIKHELTHYFDKTQNKNNKWKDLFTKDDEVPNNIQRPLITLMRKYNLGWNDIYYLCSKDEFESFCTSIEEHKKEFDKHILANLIDYTLSGKILEQPKQLRNLYLFIFVNLLFDKSRERTKYIEEHLN